MLTEREAGLLKTLRAESEISDSEDWRTVYLDNVDMRNASPREFAGLLGSLTKKGMYREIDGFFGEVRTK